MAKLSAKCLTRLRWLKILIPYVRPWLWFKRDSAHVCSFQWFLILIFMHAHNNYAIICHWFLYQATWNHWPIFSLTDPLPILPPPSPPRELVRRTPRWTLPRPIARLRSCIRPGRRSGGRTSPSSTRSLPSGASPSCEPPLMNTSG